MKSELNISRAFESAVLAKQMAYKDYKDAVIEYMNCTWIGNDGRFCYLKNDCKEKLKAAERKIYQADAQVEFYRQMVER